MHTLRTADHLASSRAAASQPSNRYLELKVLGAPLNVDLPSRRSPRPAIPQLAAVIVPFNQLDLRLSISQAHPSRHLLSTVEIGCWPAAQLPPDFAASDTS